MGIRFGVRIRWVLFAIILFHAQGGLAIAADNLPTYYPTPYWNTDGETATTHIFVGGIPVATVETSGTSAPTVFWNHTDHLGSTRIVTDAAGGIVEATDYKPFGEILSPTSGQPPAAHGHVEQRKFTGHEHDADTGYTYANARYLDTEAGRFLSQDPAFWSIPIELLADPQQMNSYAYARNNPLILVDRSGEKVELAAKSLELSPVGIHTFIRITSDPSNNNSLQHLGISSDKITLGAYPVWGLLGTLYKGMNAETDFNVNPSKLVGSVTVNKPAQYQSQTEFEQAILGEYISLPSNLGAYAWLFGDPSTNGGQVISNNLPSHLLLQVGVPPEEINLIRNTFPSHFGGYLKPLAPGVGVGLPSQRANSIVDALGALQSKLQSLFDYLKEKTKISQ